jgi:hypothetical protein
MRTTPNRCSMELYVPRLHHAEWRHVRRRGEKCQHFHHLDGDRRLERDGCAGMDEGGRSLRLRNQCEQLDQDCG